MKSFLSKTIVFFSPFIILFIITELFYSTKQEGDLTRMGFITADSDYRNKFKDQFKRPFFFKNLSDIDITKESKYSVLTIGDSFSNQGRFGYQNYLAEIDSLNVLHYDVRNNENPINLLYSIINGDLLDKITVDYIILQSTERHFVERSNSDNLNPNNTLSIEDINRLGIQQKERESQNANRSKFPPIEIIKYPLYNILYYIDDNAFFSKVYRTKTEKPLFSGKRKKELLFYSQDLLNTSVNNDRVSIMRLNNTLNDLSYKLNQKGIELIVLPCPDKFDFYYEYLVDKEKYKKPMFFELMQQMQKDYIYINSKEILSKAIDQKNDIYFFDDTHWSPIASHLIARELAKIIEKNKAQTLTLVCE